LSAGAGLFGGSVDFPAKTWVLSFGNSPEFTRLRFNFRDSKAVRLTGVNIDTRNSVTRSQLSI